MIETHAHIYDEQFDLDINTILKNAQNQGISEIWMPNCDSSTLDAMMNLAQKYPVFCLPMVGLHPCYVKDDFEKELLIIEELLSKFRPLAIGEIGLDLYWDKTYFEQQKLAFKAQCLMAQRHHLFIDIHCRDSFWETVELIENLTGPKVEGIFHCFGGGLQEAKKVIELGFLMGIGGVVTFKNAGLDKIIKDIDLKYLVLETDSPYLAPVPYRGKRNEPSYLKLIAQKIADIKEIPVEVVIEETQKNALTLKNKYSKPLTPSL